MSLIRQIRSGSRRRRGAKYRVYVRRGGSLVSVGTASTFAGAKQLFYRRKGKALARDCKVQLWRGVI